MRSNATLLVANYDHLTLTLAGFEPQTPRYTHLKHATVSPSALLTRTAKTVGYPFEFRAALKPVMNARNAKLAQS